MAARAASLLLLAFATLAAGQNDIQQTFGTVRELLERGELLQVNIETEQCTVTGPGVLQDNLYFSLVMRQWQHETMADESGQPAGEVIRAEDWYLNSGMASVAWTSRQAEIYDDGSVMVTLSFGGIDVDEGTFEFECTLGDSAVVHSFGDDETEIDRYYTYMELKSGLLLGKHVDSLAYLHRCLNAEDYLPPGFEYVSSFRVENVVVFNDGTPDEYLEIHDTSVYASNSSLNSLGETLRVWRNGSVVINSGIYENDGWSQVFAAEFQCILADSVQFTSYRRERQGTYFTFPEIKESTLRGHEMEAVVFTDLCDVKAGPTPPPVISARRFDQFQFFEAGGFNGPLEYIAFSSYDLQAEGLLTTDVVRVFEDNKLDAEWSVLNPATGELTSGELQCDLGIASLFHANSRDRRPTNSYGDIVNGVLDNGVIYEIEVDLSGCDTGDFTLASIYGGVMWETYIVDARGEEGLFYGVTFAYVKSPFGGTAWEVAGFFLQRDGTVLIDAHLYDFNTGEDLMPSNAPITCQLHEGGDNGQGSVYFYRYP